MKILSLPWKRSAFLIGLVLYALFSSPTPDAFGWAEAIVLFLLAISTSLPKIERLDGGVVFLLYGLTVPLFLAIVAGNGAVGILRDLIPFLFLFLPLFYREISEDEEFSLHLAWVLILMGLLFAGRTIISAWRGGGESFLSFSTPPDFLYLANSPEVLFSELALQSLGFYYLGMRGEWGRGGLVFFLALVPVLAMVVMQQRAFLALSALFGVAALVVMFWKNPKGLLQCLLFLGPFGLVLFPFFQEVFDMLLTKTRLVWLNGRIQEWRAVYDIVSLSLGRELFGLGWGASFANPAVGGITVNYTHSLISSLWFKTGGIGVVLAVGGVFTLAKNFLKSRPKTIFWLFPALLPVLVTLSLYASHKSFGFGLLLFLVWVLLEKNRKLEKNEPIMP